MWARGASYTNEQLLLALNKKRLFQAGLKQQDFQVYYSTAIGLFSENVYDPVDK